MTKELIYYIGGNKSKQLLTEVVLKEVIWSKGTGPQLSVTQAFATCLRKFYSPPPLDTLYAWQSFVNERFPDITWAAKVKVEMKELDTVDRPKYINREFTLTLKEVV